MDDKTTIAAGSLFCFSQGEYSDYGYSGHFVALEDIPRARLLEIGEQAQAEYQRLDRVQDEWLEAPEADRVGEYPPSPDAHGLFIAAVIKAGLALAVTCTEIHIGSYGRIEIDC